MKRAFLLAGFTTVLVACSNNSDNKVANQHTSDHSAQHTTSSNPTDETNMNAVKRTMDRMMHDMHAMKFTGDNEIDFSTMMVQHHNGAVEMSQVEIDKGSDAELKEFAQTVIADQTREINIMQNFMSKSPKSASSTSSDFQSALQHSMMPMMNDTTVIYNNIDKDYAAQMIPHHQSAVHMAEAYLRFGKDAGLITLCRNIINSQTKEVSWLKEWLSNR